MINNPYKKTPEAIADRLVLVASGRGKNERKQLTRMFHVTQTKLAFAKGVQRNKLQRNGSPGRYI